jgi:hypothetical protein
MIRPTYRWTHEVVLQLWLGAMLTPWPPSLPYMGFVGKSRSGVGTSGSVSGFGSNTKTCSTLTGHDDPKADIYYLPSDGCATPFPDAKSRLNGSGSVNPNIPNGCVCCRPYFCPHSPVSKHHQLTGCRDRQIRR